jgi:mRNA interferase HigB
MKVVNRLVIEDFIKSHQEVSGQLAAWLENIERSDCKTPLEIKSQIPNAGPIPDNRVIFDIKGNKYRLIVKINYNIGLVYVRWIGTHAEYSKINAETI